MNLWCRFVMMHVSLMYVSIMQDLMMHVSIYLRCMFEALMHVYCMHFLTWVHAWCMIIYPDTCTYAYIHDVDGMHVSSNHLDACLMHDPWPSGPTVPTVSTVPTVPSGPTGPLWMVWLDRLDWLVGMRLRIHAVHADDAHVMLCGSVVIVVLSLTHNDFWGWPSYT